MRRPIHYRIDYQITESLVMIHQEMKEELRTEILSALRKEICTEVESRDQNIDVEIATIRKATSDIVTNITRNADLSANIATEAGTEIANTWYNGELQNIEQTALKGSLKDH